MHWVLDVNFREDEHRTRERTLANDLSRLRRFAVTLLKRHPDKDSLRGKMISCGLNTDYLSQVLSLGDRRVQTYRQGSISPRHMMGESRSTDHRSAVRVGD